VTLTMKIVFRLLVLILVMGVTQPAEAGLFGWIERLSGPGPFYAVGFPFPVACRGLRDSSEKQIRNELAELLDVMFPPVLVKDDPTKEELAKKIRQDRIHEAVRSVTPRSWFPAWNCRGADRHGAYLIFGWDFLYLWTHSTNPATATKEPVRAWSIVPYIDVRLNQFVELGLGFGFTHFYGPAFGCFTRPTFEPLRVTFKPIAAISRGKYAEFVQARMTATTFGKIRSSDFDNSVESFTDSGHWTWGAMVMLDFSRVIGNKSNK